MLPIRLDVFGRHVLVERVGGGWSVSYLGSDGKKRPARDIIVPASVTEAELIEYLADLCHEWASDSHPKVTRSE